VKPVELQALPESIGVMAFSTIATLLLVLYQRYVYRKTGSLAVKADSAHYFGDILTNIAVIFALVGAMLGFIWLDIVVAVIVALTLTFSVINIVREALAVLMDQALDPDDEARLIETIQETDGVKGFHDLKTRQSGMVQFIQFHLELDGDQLLRDAHDTGRSLEVKIRERFPRAEVIIHHYPV
jgi:ferrous-iron efflux pump FieF